MDIDRIQNWKKFKPKLCSKCISTCCTLPVEVSGVDLVRLGFATEDDLMQPLKRLAKHLMKQGVVKQYREKTQIFVLIQKNGSDCLFLDSKTRFCTVYERRPTVCRGFPLTVGSRPGYCPYIPK